MNEQFKHNSTDTSDTVMPIITDNMSKDRIIMFVRNNVQYIYKYKETILTKLFGVRCDNFEIGISGRLGTMWIKAKRIR